MIRKNFCWPATRGRCSSFFGMLPIRPSRRQPHWGGGTCKVSLNQPHLSPERRRRPNHHRAYIRLTPTMVQRRVKSSFERHQNGASRGTEKTKPAKAFVAKHGFRAANSYGALPHYVGSRSPGVGSDANRAAHRNATALPAGGSGASARGAAGSGASARAAGSGASPAADHIASVLHGAGSGLNPAAPGNPATARRGAGECACHRGTFAADPHPDSDQARSYRKSRGDRIGTDFTPGTGSYRQNAWRQQSDAVG